MLARQAFLINARQRCLPHVGHRGGVRRTLRGGAPNACVRSAALHGHAASSVDEHFMSMALEEARQAAEAGEVPVGAVMVVDGQAIARSRNAVEASGQPTAHAEMLCIQAAASVSGCWRLPAATLYVTLEPCPMCAGAALQARIGTLVYGAANPLLGAAGSWVSLLPHAAGHPSAASPVRLHPFHPHMQVRGGILAEECAEAMQGFFRRRRALQRNVGPARASSEIVL